MVCRHENQIDILSGSAKQKNVRSESECARSGEFMFGHTDVIGSALQTPIRCVFLFSGSRFCVVMLLWAYILIGGLPHMALMCRIIYDVDMFKRFRI